MVLALLSFSPGFTWKACATLSNDHSSCCSKATWSPTYVFQHFRQLPALWNLIGYLLVLPLSWLAFVAALGSVSWYLIEMSSKSKAISGTVSHYHWRNWLFRKSMVTRHCSSGPPFISVFFVIREGLDISTAASMVNIFSIAFKETLVIDDEGRAFLYRGKIWD